MTPAQRAAALRLADALDEGYAYAMGEAAAFLRELAAEPQAEPVPIAWMHPTHGLVHVGNQTYGFTVPLYAHPPQQRKPLTEREIYKLHEASRLNTVTFARAVEAAHGIKEAP